MASQKTYYFIPPDAVRGFAQLPKTDKSKKHYSGVFYFPSLLFLAVIMLIVFLKKEKIADIPVTKQFAYAVSASVERENVLDAPKWDHPDIRPYGPYCDENSQAAITGLKGENSSCNLEPKIKEGKYIDVNLTKMLLRAYLNGILVKEYQVMAKGNPKAGSAARTPTGNFSALLKDPKHYSRLYFVWMPWSVEFNSGGYYLHGIPYFDNGQTIGTRYSGGCIRINTEQMKEIYDFVDVGTPIIVYE